MIIKDPIVLIVDDSENDTLLMRTVFERSGFVQPLQFARDGMEAVEYLRGDAAFADRAKFPLPTAMLLDLNMPRKNGFEVLAWIRQQPALKRLQVYVLSASNRPEDIRRAYDLGANSYLVKPGNLDGLMHLAKTLVAWLRLSEFASLAEPASSPDASPAPARFAVSPTFRVATTLSAHAEPAPGIPKVAGNGTHRIDVQMTQARNEIIPEVAALQSEKEAFGRSVGHDLRTPIMAIGGYADLLMDKAGTQLDENAREYLQKIIASTDQLGRMVVEIVARSKVSQTPWPPAGQG